MMAMKWVNLFVFLLVYGPHTGLGIRLADFTNLFRIKSDHYDADWNPGGTKPYTSQIGMDINVGCSFPGCAPINETGPSVTLANLTVVDNPAQDVQYHWMWSVIGHPVIQAAITDPGNVMTVDWSALFGFGSLSRCIRYKSAPLFSSAIMITKLIEYNDVEDEARIPVKGQDSDDDPNVIVYDVGDFSWRRNLVEQSPDLIAIELSTDNFTNPQFEIKGTINLTLSGYASDAFGRWLPHLSHSEKTNQFDVQLQNLTTNSGFNQSRFALELIIVSDDPDYVGYNFTHQRTPTLDDEHTPGIFMTEELIVPGLNETLQAYMQWRPIVYSTMGRELSASTGLHISEARDIENPSTSLNETLLYALYGMDLDNIVVKGVNVSFGSKGDGFYHKTRYQAWTFTFGTGVPIRNGFSAMVILAIAILMAITIISLGCVSTLFLIRRARRLRAEVGYSRMDQPSTVST